MQISIIMPIYNSAPNLNKSIESVLNQTFNDFELILVNDGSTDSSLEICRKYAEKDNRIIIIDKQNTGASDSRHVGINCSKGKYIGFLDSDDYIDKRMYQELYNKAVETGSDYIISGFTRVLNNKFDKIIPHYYANKSKLFIKNFSLMASYWNKLIKRDLFTDDLFFTNRIDMFEDNPVTFKLFNKAKKVEFIYDSFYYYNKYDSSVCNNVTKKSISDMFYAIENEIIYAKKNGIYNEYEKYFMYMKIHTKITALSFFLDRKYFMSIYPETIPSIFLYQIGIIYKIEIFMILINCGWVIKYLKMMYHKIKGYS